MVNDVWSRLGNCYIQNAHHNDVTVGLPAVSVMPAGRVYSGNNAGGLYTYVFLWQQLPSDACREHELALHCCSFYLFLQQKLVKNSRNDNFQHCCSLIM